MSRLHPKPDRYLSEVHYDYPLALGRCDYPLAPSRIFAVLHRRNASSAIEIQMEEGSKDQKRTDTVDIFLRNR